MGVGQDFLGDQGRILQRAGPEHQVDSLGNMIDKPFGNQDLDADVGVGSLECTNQGRKQCAGDAGRRGKPQMPETVDSWFETMLSTASLSSALRWACSRTSDPTSVSRRLRVERSSRRTPYWSSRSAMRRLTVEIGILRWRAASERLFASCTTICTYLAP